jgi:NAD+--asparagine ADP-ribosyltransferase
VFHSRHSRALSDAHKAEMELFAARTANERGQASLRAAGEVLEASRKHARETTKMLHEKMEEVDSLRTHKKVNDKDRAIKVKGSVGHVSEHNYSRT